MRGWNAGSMSCLGLQLNLTAKKYRHSLKVSSTWTTRMTPEGYSKCYKPLKSTTILPNWAWMTMEYDSSPRPLRSLTLTLWIIHWVNQNPKRLCISVPVTPNSSLNIISGCLRKSMILVVILSSKEEVKRSTRPRLSFCCMNLTKFGEKGKKGSSIRSILQRLLK